MEKTLETNSQRKPSALPVRARNWIAMILAIAMFTMPLSASALWSDTRELSVGTLGAATVPAPIEFKCSNKETGLLGLVNEAELTWVGDPQTSKFLVELRDDNGLLLGSTQVTEPRLRVTTGFLSGLVKGLLDLLLGGATFHVQVTAVGPELWQSTPVGGVALQNASLLSGKLLSLTGVACKP